jgi:putative ABC transport system permease protein
VNDLRVALRQYLRQPGFALTVVCTLAMTIGATTAVFSVVNTVLVRALPFTSPERLMWIASVRSDNRRAPFTLPEYMDYRSQVRTLSGIAAYANWSASVAGDGVTERLQGARMSANAFAVLGMSPAAGRLLNESDDRADAPRVVVLSYRLWQRKYGGSPAVVGTSARINAEPFLIVGVLPPQFPLPMRDIDVVAPLVPDRDPLRHARNSPNFLRLFGRLGPGISTEQAQSELTTICRSLRQQFPVEYARKESVRVDALHVVLIGDFRQSMLYLLAAVVVVLATALANLVSLALVRANRRVSELAMRIAIGASRWHLVRQLVVEASVLALIGAGLGWVVAVQAVAVAMRWAPASIPRLDEVSLDSTVLLFVIGVIGVVTALLTLAPLTAIAGARAGDVVRSTRGAIGDRWSHRVRNVMVVSEISAALVLVLATVVLVQNLLALQAVNPGFNPDGVFQARVSIPPTYRTPDEVTRFYERLSERIAAAPGVTQFSVISVAPLSGLLSTVPFSVAGQSSSERQNPSAIYRVISPGYFSTVATRVLQGRAFTENDMANTPHVALVSAALADRFLLGHAIGQRLMIDDNNARPRPVEIVGVVENVHHTALDLAPAFDIYIPLRQIHPDGVSLIRNNQFWLLKAGANPAAVRATFLAHLNAVDPDAAVSDSGSMRDFVEASLGPRRFNLGLFCAFASTTLLLAVIGLYGLVSYGVAQRTSEIGLRMAIGATQGDVRQMILRQAAWLGVAGVIVGLAVAAAVRQAIGVDVSISAGLVAAIAALLIGIELLAAWLPARRAARIEPTLALRHV